MSLHLDNLSTKMAMAYTKIDRAVRIEHPKEEGEGSMGPGGEAAEVLEADDAGHSAHLKVHMIRLKVSRARSMTPR